MTKKKTTLILFFPFLLSACAPSDNEVMIAQAKASIEQARAVESVAQIGQIQALNNTLFMIVLLLVIVEAAAIIYLVARSRRSERKPARRESSGRWAPGPNAGYKRLGPPPIDPAFISAYLNYQEYMSRLNGVPAEYFEDLPNFDFTEDER